MKYLVEVKSDKKKEFLQVLEALHSLRVVKRVELIDENGEKPAANPAGKEQGEEVSSREMASQYRDLVD